MFTIMVCTFRNDFRRQIVSHLSERGYKVYTPYHRQDVLSMATQEKPLVILLDMYVTHPSGMEVLRDLRAHGFNGKVILLGGNSISSLLSKAYHLGVDQMVQCPPFGVSDTIQLGQIEAAIHSSLHSVIAERAHEIYESRGRLHGHDQQDWVEAERLFFKQAPLQNTDSQSLQISLKSKQLKKSQLRLSILEDRKEVKK